MDEIRVNPPVTPDAASPIKRSGEVGQTGSNRATNAATSSTARGVTPEEAKTVADSARIAGASTASLGQLLPVSILQSPTLMRTEWAWRRLVLDALMQMMNDAAENSASQAGVGASKSMEATLSTLAGGGQGKEPGIQPGIQPGMEALLEKSLQTLWNHLDVLSQATQRAPQEINWPGALPDAPVQAFAHLQKVDIDKLDTSQRAVVLLDRMEAATKTETDPRVGSGFFFPGVPTGVTEGGTDRKAVRWQAQRQTRVTRTGQIVYRLKLNIEVSGRPVEITFLSAKPTLAVHIKTDDSRLRRRVEAPDASILAVLHGLGWQVDNWSAGDGGDSVAGGIEPSNMKT
jgi:hypothetical protein